VCLYHVQPSVETLGYCHFEAREVRRRVNTGVKLGREPASREILAFRVALRLLPNFVSLKQMKIAQRFSAGWTVGNNESRQGRKNVDCD
jgi:hypothetical protein